MSSKEKNIFIVEGLRTPFTKVGKEFAHLHPAELASQNMREFLYKMDFQGDEIEEIIFGNAFTLADASNIARVSALQAGFPKTISATTTLRNCASSMESFSTGMAKIKAGFYNSVLVGGVESMSHIHLWHSIKLSQTLKQFMMSKKLKQKLKTLLSLKLSDLKPISPLLEGLTDPLTGYSMGDTAELLAKEFSITREEQDDFALLSHQKALKAEKKLQEEMFPFITETQTVFKDKGVSQSLSKKRLSKFSPYFDKEYGSVTVANSCPLNDGSSLLLLMSEEKLKALGLKPLVVVKAVCFTGLEPERMGLGPVYASAKILKQTGLQLKDIDLIEINEAFSAQILACLRAFSSSKFCEEKLGLNSALGDINPDKLNVNGGALAIGHPISATGSRLILTLAKEMKRRNVQFGLASLCVGGGQGGAVILENTN